MEYSRCFWQSERTRLRPLRLEDAEQSFVTSLDSPSRQVLQLGIELPSSVALQRETFKQYMGCRDHNGVIVFVIESLAGEDLGSISPHSRDTKNGRFSFGIVLDRRSPLCGKFSLAKGTR